MMNRLFDRVINIAFYHNLLSEQLILPHSALLDEQLALKKKYQLNTWALQKEKTELDAGSSSRIDKLIKKREKLEAKLDKNAKLIDENTHTVNKEVVIIHTPTAGPKPDISVSLSLLPNNICYEVTVTITNFAVSRNIDIRNLNLMSISLGYREGGLLRLTCPIFVSYQAKPNPNGVTVFKGLTVGTYGAAMFSSNAYQVVFNPGVYTLKEFLDYMQKGLKDLVTFVYDMPDETLARSIVIMDNKCSAENGYAVLVWLSNIIQTWGQRQDPPLDMQCKFSQDRFTISQITAWAVATFPEENTLPVLRRIYSASLTATILTVEAPYDPRISPNSVFAMPVRYYTGNVLPNESDVLKEPTVLWRVITMRVQFSTIGSTNTMSIMALPARDVSSISPTADTSELLATASQQAQKELAKAKAKGYKAIEIEVGTKKKEDNALASMYGLPPPSVTTKEYVVKINDTWSGIYTREFGNEKWKATGEQINSDDLVAFFKKLHNKDGVPLWAFFPLSIVLTYAKYKEATDTDKTKWGINDGNVFQPDSIVEDTTVLLPASKNDLLNLIKSSMGDSNFADMFALMRDYYQSRTVKTGVSSGDWRSSFKDIMDDIQYQIRNGK